MRSSPSARGLFLVAILIVAALHLVGLGGTLLLEPDEGRYADVARGFLDGGSLVVPRANGIPFLDKPPLVCWAAAASMKVLGPSTLALRLVPALSGILAALVAGLLAQVCYRKGAWAAALVYGCAPLALGVGRTFTLDVPLATLVSFGGFLVLAGAGAFDSIRKSHRLSLAGGLVLGLATLVKGPVAIGLGGLAVVAALFGEGRSRRLLSPLPWLVAVAVAAPWYWLVAREEPVLARAFFLDENLLRFAGTAFEHRHGPFFFFVTLAWGLGGGSLAGLVLLGTRPPLPRGAGVLVGWAALVFAFFSISSTKVETYILPAFPLLAGVLGAEIETAIEEREGPVWRGLVVSFHVFTAALALMAAGFAAFAAGHVPVADENAETIRQGCSAVLGLLPLVPVAGAALLARSRRPRAALLALGVASLCILYAVLGALQGFSHFKSAAPMAKLIEEARRTSPGVKVAGYHIYYRGLPFFLGEPVVLLGEKSELKLEGFAKHPELYMPDLTLNNGAATYFDDCWTRAYLVAERPLLVIMTSNQRRPQRFLDACARAGVTAKLRGQDGEHMVFEVLR